MALCYSRGFPPTFGSSQTGRRPEHSSKSRGLFRNRNLELLLVEQVLEQVLEEELLQR